MKEPRFFGSAKAWRAWLEKNHATATELVLGFHKANSDRSGMTRPEAVDEALAFGWIDGRVNGGDTTWSVRFTPRQPKSIWSAVNLRRVEELKAAGRMHAAGLATHESRDPERQKKYSFENRDAKLPPAMARKFRAEKKAWTNFEKLPPSYKHPAIWWVVSARQEATRERRLAALIADSAAGVRLKHLRRVEKKK
jgi:uncharacterized protein YdeI (YjbR/CyaY-like superfamily)